MIGFLIRFILIVTFAALCVAVTPLIAVVMVSLFLLRLYPRKAVYYR